MSSLLINSSIFNPLGVGLEVGLGSWSVHLSGSQVRFPLAPISMGKSIQSFALALNGASASERWDWSPRISRSLDRIPSLTKKKKLNFQNNWQL